MTDFAGKIATLTTMKGTRVPGVDAFLDFAGKFSGLEPDVVYTAGSSIESDWVKVALETRDVIFSGVNVTGLSASQAVMTDASKNLISADYLNQAVKSTSSPSFAKVTSTVATGTEPFSCTSTTVNTNLNADLWDGYQFSDYLNQAVKTTSNVTFGTVDSTGFKCSTVVGLASQVVALAKLTPVTGTDGSITISGGIVTAYTAPT